MLLLIFILSLFHYSNNLPVDNLTNVYVGSIVWNAKQWHLIPVPSEIINVTDLSPFFRKKAVTTYQPEKKNSSWICNSICLNGGIPTKNGNICKCAYIDDECCTTEDQCFINYCSEDERAEGASREKCRFFPLQNRCYSYNYMSIYS